MIEQRLRNRLIEWLEFVVENPAEPPPYGLVELINDWQDWNSEPISEETFPAPVWIGEEIDALQAVNRAWNIFCEVTPRAIADEMAAMQRPEWESLVISAQAALAIFMRRGRLSEDDLI